MLPLDRRSRLRLTAVLLAFSLLPVQFAFLLVFDVEGYPALSQPGFGGIGPLQNGLLYSEALEIEVLFDDGKSATLTSAQLLPDTGGIEERFMLEATFKDLERASHPTTIEWLKKRLHVLFPTDHAVELTFSWSLYQAPVRTLTASELSEIRWKTLIDLTQP